MFYRSSQMIQSAEREARLSYYGPQKLCLMANKRKRGAMIGSNRQGRLLRINDGANAPWKK